MSVLSHTVARVEAQKLRLLLFGPDIKYIAADPLLRKLQLKRMAIWTALDHDGHDVKYGEDVVDPNLPPPMNNALFQEPDLIKDYDYTFLLIGSPGSHLEAGIPALRPELASKMYLFLHDAHTSGLVWEACQLAVSFGAKFYSYDEAADLDLCGLLTRVRIRVREMQMLRALT